MSQAASGVFLAVVVVLAVLFLVVWWQGLPEVVPTPWEEGRHGGSGGSGTAECSDVAPLARPQELGVPVKPGLHLQERAGEDAIRAQLASAIRTGACRPEVWTCASGKVYLVCRDFLFGKDGLVPAYPTATGYIAATAYLVPDADKVLARDKCMRAGGE